MLQRFRVGDEVDSLQDAQADSGLVDVSCPSVARLSAHKYCPFTSHNSAVIAALPFAVTEKTPSTAARSKAARLWNMRPRYIIPLSLLLLAVCLHSCNACESNMTRRGRALQAHSSTEDPQAGNTGTRIDVALCTIQPASVPKAVLQHGLTG